MRLYIILSDEHRRRRDIYVPTREPSSKRARDGSFFFSFVFCSSSYFISLSLSSVSIFSHLSRLHSLNKRSASCFRKRDSCAMGLFLSMIRKSTESVLLAHRTTTLMDRTDGRFLARAFSPSYFFLYPPRLALIIHPGAPSPPDDGRSKTSPFQSHSTLLRFSSRDSSLVKFRSHNPEPPSYTPPVE